jgi:quercetin dioxygenase-like cupin family protein
VFFRAIKKKDAMKYIEHILGDQGPLAYFVYSNFSPDRTTFLTPETFDLQMGVVVYPEGGEIPRHFHTSQERTTKGFTEVIIVKSGRCEVDIYDKENILVATREMKQGDIVMLIDGGHGFRALEELQLFEIKQGPYIGIEEKERF